MNKQNPRSKTYFFFESKNCPKDFPRHLEVVRAVLSSQGETLLSYQIVDEPQAFLHAFGMEGEEGSHEFCGACVAELMLEENSKQLKNPEKLFQKCPEVRELFKEGRFKCPERVEGGENLPLFLQSLFEEFLLSPNPTDPKMVN